MTSTRTCMLVSALAASSLLYVGTSHAQDAGVDAGHSTVASAVAPIPNTREYSRDGELSPGASAPSIAAMLAAIDKGSPETFRATLEYGERVLCTECVPLLENKLLSSSVPRVREMSAWWLRRQPFAGPAVFKQLKAVLSTDTDATRRSRAAEALGEFMDPFGLDVLAKAATQDADAGVRGSAVRALARLNHPGSGAAIAAALADANPSVRAAALDVLISVVGYANFASVLPLLADADPAIRTHAARICGEVHYQAAETMLIAALDGDTSAGVRKAAAWALGRIGGAAGRAALDAHKARERDPLVLSAIDVAERMSPRAP
ncbi:MAG: repeat protein [Myxococcaceae bacterium]|nr:repeat protein [Myxococcaceae bacterium]